MKLLTDFGHYLGLPAPLELVEDDDDLWQEFVQNQTRIGRSLGEKDRAMLLRFVQAREVMDLARRARPAVLQVPGLSPGEPCSPSLTFTQQIDQAGRATTSPDRRRNCASGKSVSAGIGNICACLFVSRRQTPDLLNSGRKNLRLCESGSAPPPRVSRQRCSMIILIFDSTTDWSLTTIKSRSRKSCCIIRSLLLRIREESFRVILDEAQDTEPLQFSVLLELTRPPEAKGLWLQDRQLGPRRGHFCMVGDFQQSIYWKRADLNYYRAVHDALVADKNGESLEFAVTFRLDQKQLDFVNETFREILNNKDGQVRFVELQPRPNTVAGKVIHVPLAEELLPEGKKLKDYQKARIEADYLAGWIKNAGLKKLSADSWREVAILCPVLKPGCKRWPQRYGASAYQWQFNLKMMLKATARLMPG